MPPQDPEKKELNLDNILLPKKEVRTSASATRQNAGVLLEEEQKAELPKEKAAPIVPPEKPAGPVDTASVKPLETYQRDMESVISSQNVSAVNIVSAEAKRASQLQNAPAGSTRSWSWVRTLAAALAGVVLLSVAAGVLIYVFTRPAPTVQVATQAAAPFIKVDETRVLIATPEQLNHTTLMQNLVELSKNTTIPLGLINRIYVAVASSSLQGNLSAAAPVNAQQFLSAIAPNVPDPLLRTIDPQYYLLGLHSFDENQAFLMFRVDSYEQAFSAMLQWERTMPQELSPFFIRNPSPKLNGTESTTTAPQPSLLPTAFSDAIVSNHDTRALMNASGDIVLLWTFIDRQTLVIANNESTLTELISRTGAFTAGQ